MLDDKFISREREDGGADAYQAKFMERSGWQLTIECRPGGGILNDTLMETMSSKRFLADLMTQDKTNKMIRHVNDSLGA